MRSFVVVVLGCLGCVASQPVIAPATGDDVTVFIHGYRGSFLQTADGEVAWLTPGAAISRGEKSLAFSFEGQRDFPRFGPLKPAGPLTTLTVVPLLLQQVVYLPWVEWARDALPGFIVYSYDWRRDVRDSAADFCGFLEGLGPTRRIRVVAHSMGGLVTLQCLRRGPEAVRRAVTHVAFVGTPFRGGVGQWDDLFIGTKTQSNTALMSAEALLTFSSTWQLLAPRPDFFVDEQGAPTALDAYATSTWVDKHWGLFADPTVNASAAYRAQLEARLSDHGALWASLADEDGPAPPLKVLAVIGVGRPSISGWTVKSDGTVDLEHPLFADGDGTVLTARTGVPKPLHPTVVESKAEHSALLNDDAVQRAIKDFVTR